MEHCQHSFQRQCVWRLCTPERLCSLKHIFLFVVRCPIIRVHCVDWLLWPCPEPNLLQEVLCNFQCCLCMLRKGVLLQGYAFPQRHGVLRPFCSTQTREMRDELVGDELIPRGLGIGEEGPMQKHAVPHTLCKLNPGLQLCP